MEQQAIHGLMIQQNREVSKGHGSQRLWRNLWVTIQPKHTLKQNLLQHVSAAVLPPSLPCGLWLLLPHVCCSGRVCNRWQHRRDFFSSSVILFCLSFWFATLCFEGALTAVGNVEWHCVCAYELQCMNDELYGDVLKWGGVFLLGFFCCCFLVWFGFCFVSDI